jgi:hypothetical protein
VRDLRRKLADRPEVAEHFAEALARVERLLAQQRTDKNKLYALHAVNAERTFLKSAEVNFPTRRASVFRCWREQGLWAWADGRGGGAAVRAAAAR